MDYNDIINKHNKVCCGCEACSYVCPKHVIKMQEDKEGFVYPVTVNEENCISCGLCDKICPISNPLKANDTIRGFCSGYLKEDEDIRSSASGGLATAISRCFIEKCNGIVYGVSYSDDFKSVRFERVVSVGGLEKFRGSKYVQARKSSEYVNHEYAYSGGRVFESVLADLRSKRNVLFIGLPCEIAALAKITMGKNDNLYTMELVCHGPTSQKVHRNYISDVERAVDSKISSFSVRYKHTGWKPYYIKADFQKKYNSNYLVPFHESTYGIAFRYLKRPSCSQCIFKLGNKDSGLHADITIGDFHYAGASHEAWNKWGSSVGYIHTDKGRILTDITKHAFRFIKTNPQHAMKSSFALENSVPSRFNRRTFSKVFVSKSLNAACSLPSVFIIDGKDYLEKKILRMMVAIRNVIIR